MSHMFQKDEATGVDENHSLFLTGISTQPSTNPELT